MHNYDTALDNLPFEPGVVENETVAPHQGAFESDDIALLPTDDAGHLENPRVEPDSDSDTI